MQSLDAFDQQYPDDNACKARLAAVRWPNGVTCPRCGSKERIYALKSKPFHWVCKSGLNSRDYDGRPVTCDRKNGYRFSVISHTIFQDTKIELKLWFKVGFLMLNAKKGMSSLQVRRVIFGEESGTDWRTCWYMCHRWRAAMRGDAFPLEGEIEADETYIGGKDRNRHWAKKSRQQREAGTGFGYGKVGVIGAIARKGSVVARVLGDTDAQTKAGFVRSVIADKVDLVATDENIDYKHLGRDVPHEFVTHSRGEYVRGNVHTNNIEGFWSLLKRGVVGTYHKVSADYLPLYLNEFSYRHNNRKNPDIFEDLLTTCDK
jgi:hypothetical protein